MIKECKKCGSKNLYLEPRIKGQDILIADMVALKCKDCGSWLKWCPKDERKYYYANTQQKQDTRWHKLKEWLEVEHDYYLNENYQDCAFSVKEVLDKMRELEGEDE